MPGTKTKKSPQVSEQPLVIGIGASAGGVEALQALLGALPSGNAGMSFVVVMHVDATPKDLLPVVISKFTRMPVEEAHDGARIKPGIIYTAPGHRFITIKNGVLQLSPPCKPWEWRNPIDKFFHSLARDQGERAVGVILSGMGNDGVQGIKEISKAGGMVLVQAPTTAKQEEMPQNAIDTGVADHVLAPVNISEELLAYAGHMKISGERDDYAKLQAQMEDSLPNICEILLQVTGHNFRHYKISTLTRRIQRRIQVLRVPSVREYERRLKNDEAEVRHLFNDLLIGVTAFFRDPEAFEALYREALPRLFKDRKPEETLRIWVPGCASGEEAYTLAMLIREYLDEKEVRPEVQIFATDIDEEALAHARQGAYGLGIADELTPDRLKRFFVKKAQHYHVSKELRAMVLFSVHNLINDPPFSRLDMISCRNLLIYLGSHLQKKLIPLFHYALRPGGILFLGPSENLSSHRELFRPLNARYRISQRLPTTVRSTAFFSGRNGPPTLVKPPNVPSVTENDTYLLMQRIILDEFAPKALVLDEEGQILCASGNLEKYLTVTAGAFQNNAMRLVREGLRLALRTTLAEAARIRRQVAHNGLSLRTKEGVQRVMLTVQPMPHMGEDSGLFLVVFQDIGPPIKGEAATTPSNEDAGALIDQLERELMTTREDLERTVQDLEAANEELKSSNEELLSMNEELQSANEELETSKEEVQAANDNLNRANTDLENLLASTQIGTIFLDNEMNVRRVTPSVSAIYNLLPSDTGRPLSHFTHKAKHMPPLPSIREIQESSKALEDEIELQDGAWYIRRVLPYRTPEGAPEGVLLLFTEITERKHSEIALRKSEERLRLALAASKLGVLTWNISADEITLSPRAAEIFGVKETATSWASLRELVHPDDRKQVQKSLERSLKEDADYSIEYRVERQDGQEIWVLSTGHGEYDRTGKPTGMIRLVQDITERKTAEDRLLASERLYRAIGESIKYGVWVCDPDGKNVYASPSFLDLVGMTQKECSAFGWGKALHPDQLRQMMADWKKCVREGWPLWDKEQSFKGVDGKWHTLLARGIPVKNDNGEITCWAGINLDISRMKQVEASLRESEERFRNMADSAPVLIWMSDTTRACTWFNKPWLDFVGRPMEKELGEGWIENVHPDDRDRCRRMYENAFGNREAFRMEYRLRRYDGQYRWIMDTGLPMFSDKDNFDGYIGCCIDITDHKTAMAALQEADQRKDEFLAILAHELRNPLAPLSNGLEIIRRAGTARPELLKEAQGMMERQVGHMVRLVDDLLDVSRITRGQIELHKQSLVLQDVVQNAVEISQPLIAAKKHKLDISLPDAPITMIGDATRLSQVIANLLNNAAKYTPDGGAIQLELLKEKRQVTIIVRDNGIGIPTDMLDKIFEVFVQVDTAMERAHGGLGIGLTLVRKLVELHGGAIGAKSGGIGKGSEFSIMLPLTPE